VIGIASIAVLLALALLLKPLLFPRPVKPAKRIVTPEELEDFELPPYNGIYRR
jgi:hypothetical protein